jgi:hypothetical protein
LTEDPSVKITRDRSMQQSHRDHIGVQSPDGQGGGDARDDVLVPVVPVHQENLDQRAGSAAVSVGLACGGPERLVDSSERAGGAGLDQCSGPGHRPGLADQDLEVVIEGEDLAAAGGGPFVAGDLAPAVEDDQFRGAQDRPDPVPDQPRRHRVMALAHGDPGVAVDPRGQDQPGLEPLARQRSQHPGLEGEVLGDAGRAVGDPPGVITGVVADQALVELRQARDDGDWDEVIAPEPPTLALHAALLVRAGDPG